MKWRSFAPKNKTNRTRQAGRFALTTTKGASRRNVLKSGASAAALASVSSPFLVFLPIKLRLAERVRDDGGRRHCRESACGGGALEQCATGRN